MTVTEEDELLHEPDNRKKYRESYYFNWVDNVSKVSGFTTIGILPNEKKREFVFLLFVDDDMATVHYKEPVLEKYSNDINDMLTDNVLAYRMVKPLKTWKITLETEDIDFELDFETRFQVFDFGRDSSASWHGHFEASGKIKGQVKLANGTRRMISGFGQRDKSWGYRDWHQFDKWYAGHVQFERWSIGFRKDYQRNKVDLSGFLTSDSGISLLTELEIETTNEEDNDRTPLTSTYRVTAVNGKKCTISTERLGKNTGFRFARDFTGGYTELFEQMVTMKDTETGETGTGMSEYLRTVNTE